MYGSIFKMTAKPGKRDEVIATMEAWRHEVKPISGVRGGWLLKSDSNSDQLIAVAIAPDEESYRKNADSPGQNEWYEKVRSLLVDDPEWNDGEFLEME